MRRSRIPVHEPPAAVGPVEAGVLMVVAAVILITGVRLVLGPEERLAFLLYDDAYYYLGVARHMAAGLASSFDGLTATNGYHPLWAWLLTPCLRLVPDPGAGLRLAAMLWFELAAAAPIALWWALRPRTGAAGATLAAALFGLQPVLALGLARPNGLETPLYALAIALFVAVYGRLGPPASAADRRRLLPPRWLGAGALLGLVILARFDGGMLALAAAALLAWSGWRRRAAAAGAPPAAAAWAPLAALTLGAVLVAGPSLAWNTMRFGSPIPVSGRTVGLYAAAERADLGGTLAPSFIKRRLGEGLERMPLMLVEAALDGTTLARSAARSGKAGALLTLLAAAALSWAALRRRRGPPAADPLALLLLFALLHYAAYAAWLWTDSESRYRLYYFMPQAMAAAAVLGAWAGPGLQRLLRTPAARIAAAALALFVLGWRLGAVQVETWARYQAEPGPVAERRIYGWVRETLPPDAVLGARDAGKLGWFSGRPVVNLDGLANDESFLAALRDGGVDGWIEASPIDYLLSGRPWVGEFDPIRPWVTAPAGSAPGSAGPALPTQPLRTSQEQVLSLLALRPGVTLREIPGAPDDWVVYRIDRR